MSPEQQERLHAEVELGYRAQRAFDTYLKDFIERVEQDLYDKFTSCSLDVEQLVHIKQRSMVIEAMKAKIITDIDSGKVALQQLSKEN